LNWSPADLARALEATRAEVEGWEAGLWRPREPALKLLEMLEKGSALYYSAVDDSDEGCPLWHPLRAESAAAARAEAEKAHFQAAGENKPRIILAENRALKSRRNEDAGFRVVAVWSEKRGWMDSD
jgi:hypothetical protein